MIIRPMIIRIAAIVRRNPRLKQIAMMCLGLVPFMRRGVSDLLVADHAAKVLDAAKRRGQGWVLQVDPERLAAWQRLKAG